MGTVQAAGELAARLRDLAAKCRDKADHAMNDAHALQWRFASIVLRFAADDATLPAEYPGRERWTSTYEYLREANERATGSGRVAHKENE